jgi:hypothetical protein
MSQSGIHWARWDSRGITNLHVVKADSLPVLNFHLCGVGTSEVNVRVATRPPPLETPATSRVRQWGCTV